MRSNLWASGYDVDGTDQTSLGQFSGRVQQTYKHSVPRFFVPEHGTMFTLALVRFRSEERFSRNAETDLVCRLLLEKKKNSLKCMMVVRQDANSVIEYRSDGLHPVVVLDVDEVQRRDIRLED